MTTRALKQGRKEGRKKVPEEGIEPHSLEGLRAAGVPLELSGAPLPNPHPVWSAATPLPLPSVFPSVQWLPAGQDLKTPCQL